MDARQVLQRWSDEQGWSATTERDLLLNFLNSQGDELATSLERWLREVAETENAG